VGFDLTYGYNHHFYDPDINSSNNGLNDDLGALVTRRYTLIGQKALIKIMIRALLTGILAELHISYPMYLSPLMF
jgi:hypothetical protein